MTKVTPQPAMAGILSPRIVRTMATSAVKKGSIMIMGVAS
jgi:hypothetical protein